MKKQEIEVISRAKKEAMQRLRVKGIPAKVIASKLGVSTSTVYRNTK